jgi:hypothetical protein
MPLPWIVALKVFNEGKSAWCVPKKGGAEYAEVKAIQDRTSPAKTEARNVERRAKAMEQLKSIDTRAEIERKRAARPKPKTESAMSRAMNIEDLQRVVGSYTRRPEAKRLIKEAPETLAYLKAEGDLMRIVNETAPKMEANHYILEAGKPKREVRDTSGITRHSVFVTGVQAWHQFISPKLVGVEGETQRAELIAINKALTGIKLAWFILKTSSKTIIRLAEPDYAHFNNPYLSKTKRIFYFGYEGTPTEADKDLLRELNALLK